MENVQEYIHSRISSLVEKIMLCEDERQSIIREIITLKNTVINSGTNRIFESLFDKYIDMLENVMVKQKRETESKEKRKCRYFNRGFCKYGDKCNYYHASVTCQEYIEKGICTKTLCSERHPKTCKHWARDPQGCRRHESCQYLHKDSEKCKGNDVIDVSGEHENSDDRTSDTIEGQIGQDHDDTNGTEESDVCDVCNWDFWNKNHQESHIQEGMTRCLGEREHNNRLEQMLTYYENMEDEDKADGIRERETTIVQRDEEECVWESKSVGNKEAEKFSPPIFIVN